jgi:hypothetical protein
MATRHAPPPAPGGRAAFGCVLIAFGLLEFLAAAGLGGLWLVFLGCFLLAAARAEAHASALATELAGLRVAEAARRPVASGEPPGDRLDPRGRARPAVHDRK